MKNIFIYSAFSLMAIIGMSCHKIDTVTSGYLTESNFPNTPTQYVEATGPIYTNFRGDYVTSNWYLQSLSSDEAALVAHNGSWYDAGQYMQLSMHSWTRDNGMIGACWTWVTSTISTCNQVLDNILSKAPSSSSKNQFIAEVRTMRAINYFIMMDLWGNVPISTKFGDTTTAITSSRSDVFKFIVSEVKEALPDLSSETGVTTYGRPNKYTAYALLAKMYLNQQVYTGTANWDSSIVMCDSIIGSNEFNLESDYRAMFMPNNGPTTGGSKEFIFAIPYDNKNAQGQYFSRYYMHRSLEMETKFSLPTKASGPMGSWPEFYANYDTLTNDQRNNVWMKGLQYYWDGTPVIITTTNIGHDANYNGSDPNSTYKYHLNITPNIVFKTPSSFDVGADELSWAMGYRCMKFYPDSTSATRNQSNDVPIFRYADILLMKAEAILRGGAATKGQTPLSLMNEVQTARGADQYSSVSLQELYRDRSREFAWEAWHRNDMIRFGKYENTWGIKTDNSEYRRLFPIPTTALTLNPSLTQNPGY